jgi:hypothetical protein
MFDLSRFALPPDKLALFDELMNAVERGKRYELDS